ncbi:restriction endonuclease subunit S, partial [Enterorhabdus sp. NM05_H27]
MADQRKCENDSVPALRFEGFSDPWEQRAFGEFIHASGLRNADNLDFESYSVSNTSGFVPQSEQFENGGTMAEADKTAYWIVEPGSFAYNPARINVGSIGYLSTRENVIVSSLYEVFRSDETCDDRFLWHWFKTALFAKQIEALQEGGVRLYFFFDKLLKSRIAMPSTGEQHAIGSFFDLLDSLITLHQRKVDKLKTVKQSLLEKMFPREGESVPEIRFEGFTDPWEQRAFGEFIHASGLRNADNLDFESYSVSNTSGFVPQSEQFENGGTMAEADKTAYWIVEPGSFAYNPARINVGSIGYLSTRENVIVSSLYEVFRSDETCDDRFLWHWFKTALFAKQIEALQEGGVRLYFFFDKLLKSRIAMPSTGEQHAIGSFFDLLDSLITLHQR